MDEMLPYKSLFLYFNWPKTVVILVKYYFGHAISSPVPPLWYVLN